MSKSPITCHVLDASIGKPAAGVKVSLDVLSIDGVNNGDGRPTTLEVPRTLSTGETNNDGRCVDLLDHDLELPPGVYKMTFHTSVYFGSRGVNTFYPLVEITFHYANPSEHYHIPLLLSPHSYTTYRGS